MLEPSRVCLGGQRVSARYKMTAISRAITHPYDSKTFTPGRINSVILLRWQESCSDPALLPRYCICNRRAPLVLINSMNRVYPCAPYRAWPNVYEVTGVRIAACRSLPDHRTSTEQAMIQANETRPGPRIERNNSCYHWASSDDGATFSREGRGFIQINRVYPRSRRGPSTYADDPATTRII